MDDEIFQESPRKKAVWLAEAEKKYPLWSPVRVVTSDQEAYVGKTGIVVGYDIGTSGEWPTIRVQLANDKDGFYEDEIERIEGEV